MLYFYLFLFSYLVNLDLLGVDLRDLVQGMKLATGELINNKQNRRLKVCLAQTPLLYPLTGTLLCGSCSGVLFGD